MELFAKIVNGLKRLTIFAKSSFLDSRLGSQYISAYALAKVAHFKGPSELTDPKLCDCIDLDNFSWQFQFY